MKYETIREPFWYSKLQLGEIQGLRVPRQNVKCDAFIRLNVKIVIFLRCYNAANFNGSLQPFRTIYHMAQVKVTSKYSDFFYT